MGKRTVTTTILECDFCGNYQNETVFVGNTQWYFVHNYALWHRQFFKEACIPDDFPQQLICGECLSKVKPFLEKLAIPYDIKHESPTRPGRIAGRLFIGEI